MKRQLAALDDSLSNNNSCKGHESKQATLWQFELQLETCLHSVPILRRGTRF